MPVTLRVGPLEEGTASLDHEATWLIGHTQHVTFADLWEDEGELYVDATLHIPCRYLRQDGTTATCTAYGYTGASPRGPYRAEQPRQLPRERFTIVENRRDHSPGTPTPAPKPPGAEWAQPLRPGTLSDGGSPPGGGLLPGSPDRDHVYPPAKEAGGPGAIAPVTVSVQGGPRRRFFHRGGDHLRLWVPRWRWDRLQSARAARGRTGAPPSRIFAANGRPKSRVFTLGVFLPAGVAESGKSVQVPVSTPSSRTTRHAPPGLLPVPEELQ